MNKKLVPRHGGGCQSTRIDPSTKPPKIPTDLIFRSLAVFDGRVCLGHLLPCGRQGFEAFDTADRPIGVFPTQKAGADALSAVGARHG